MAKDNAESSLSNKSILLSISSLLSKVISLASTMIIVRMLDPAAYATYKQVFLAFNVVLPFLSFGLTNGLFYYLPFETQRIRGRVNDCYAVYLISGVVFSVFVLLGGNVILSERFNNPDVSSLMLYTIPYMIITLLTQCNYAIFNIMNRVKLYMIYNVCSGLVTSAALIAAILFAPTAKSVVLASTVTKSAEGIILLLLTSKILPRDESRPQIKAIIEIVKFSLPMGIAGMIANFSVQLDSLFVSFMRTPEEFAVYTVGAHELILIGVVTASICAAVTPALRLSVAEGRLKDCSDLFILSAKRMASMLVPMMCFFWVWASEFLTFIYSDKYLAAVWIFRVYLLYFLLRISVTGQVFTALGMGRYILIRTIVTCILNAVLNYIGINLFGSIGAAIATILSGWLIFIFSIAPMLKKKLGMKLSETYPIGLVAGSLGLGMITGYAVELTVGRLLVPWLQKIINFGSILQALGMYGEDGAETVSTLNAALDLGVCCIFFMLVYIPLAILLMHRDYIWMIDKTKEIFAKLFRKKKQTAVPEG